MQYVAKAWISELLLKAPFIQPLGVELLMAVPDKIHLRLPLRQELTGVDQYVHSGAIAALAEFAGTVAAVSGVEDQDLVAACLTSQLNLTFVSTPHGKAIDAVATVVHRTEKQAVVDISIHGDDCRILAKATTICRIFEQPGLVEQAA